MSTPDLIATLLSTSKHVSDLIFSPGRAPQVELNGQLVEANINGVGALAPADTARIATDLIGSNGHAA